MWAGRCHRSFRYGINIDELPLALPILLYMCSYIIFTCHDVFIVILVLIFVLFDGLLSVRLRYSWWRSLPLLLEGFNLILGCPVLFPLLVGVGSALLLQGLGGLFSVRDVNRSLLWVATTRIGNRIVGVWHQIVDFRSSLNTAVIRRGNHLEPRLRAGLTPHQVILLLDISLDIHGKFLL